MPSIMDQTTQIVSAQISATLGSITLADIVESIKTIHATIAGLQDQRDIPTPADSIRDKEVICLECGGSYKLLSNKHLGTHGLTPISYKEKHGLRRGQPLSSKSLTRKRRAAAKSAGMGTQLAQWRAARRQSA